jgi:hypothetical protein
MIYNQWRTQNFFRGGGGQGKNITHFTINKIMQILDIF